MERLRRGEVWWANLGDPAGSEAGYRRPVLIVSSNAINDSTFKTVLTVPVTTNLNREHYETNVRLAARATGLPYPCVAVLSLITTTNKQVLSSRVGRLPDDVMTHVDAALRLVLAL